MEIELELCLVCKKTETYRKCSECENIPLCVICEIHHEHKKAIAQVMANHKTPTRKTDLEKT